VDCHQQVRSVPHRPAPAKVDCGRCHSEAAQRELLAAKARIAPALSTHAAAKQIGAIGKPACRDCHGVRAISDPASRLGRKQIVNTCGLCHARVAADYRESVHGKALLAGNRDVPTCDSCHPEHPEARRLGISQRGVVATCVSCHEDPGLQQRYAIPGNRLASYMGSYHGAATQLGDSRTANCASCHGAHRILPSRDPRSSVSPANLARTCGHCHPGASAHFAQGRVHLQPSPRQDRAVFFVKVAYQLFIAGLMAAFIGYIGLELAARLWGRFAPREDRGSGEQERQFERLTLNQRLQHWVLILSFLVLMITGLPLASPKSAVARGVISFLGGMGARAALHRAAAIVLIALVCYHVLYVLLSRKGYWEFRQLLPGLDDGLDLLQMLGFYFGLTPVWPRFGRYNYIEKFEYLAVGWGSAIMISTGALLWAPQLSLILLPKWVMDIAFIVHSWEAILAFLAIIIWHLYNVHLNPSVFPMSKVWLTGRVSLSELRENHPREYEAYLRQQPRLDSEQR
jgi:cytochrome b subunit of formate dehydrogenase